MHCVAGAHDKADMADNVAFSIAKQRAEYKKPMYFLLTCPSQPVSKPLARYVAETGESGGSSSGIRDPHGESRMLVAPHTIARCLDLYKTALAIDNRCW
jgi:hypothetical protein